jgi:hypothetical protein
MKLNYIYDMGDKEFPDHFAMYGRKEPQWFRFECNESENLVRIPVSDPNASEEE